jgi:hypothetical protein
MSTGIDIRTGLNWNALIVPPVLMNVMYHGSVGLPKGLIRYASEDEIEKKSLSNSQQE